MTEVENKIRPELPAGLGMESSHCGPEDAMACLLSVTQELNATDGLEEGLQRFSELLHKYVPYRTLGVLLLDELGRELRFVHASGHPTEVVEHWRFGLGQGIVGTAAREGRAILVNDVETDGRYIAAATGVRSELALPLVTKERVIGVLDVGGGEKDFFSPGDQRLLGFLADHLARAIENARLYENMRRQARTLSLLHEVSRELTSILDRRELLETVGERIRRLIDYDVFTVLLYDAEKQLLEPSVSVLKDGSKASIAQAIPLGHGISGTAAALLQPQRVPNVGIDPRYISCVSDLEVRSELVVPLIFKGRLLGVVDLESSEYDAFSQHDQQLLSTLASSLAIALENASLYEKLRRDEQRLEEDLSTAREVQKSLLPKSTPWVNGLQIAVAYEPANHLGGDFYDFVDYGDGRLAIAVGDVSGKATSAALFGSLSIGMLREYATQNALEPGDLLAGLNERIRKLGFPSRYLAMGYAIYEAEGRRLSLANSGLPYPYLLRQGEIEQVEVGGVPLGLLPQRRYEQKSVELAPGDVLVLTSDGVEDSLDRHEVEFGQERLRSTLAGLASKSAAEIADGVLRAVAAFSGSAEIYDDRTILVLKAT